MKVKYLNAKLMGKNFGVFDTVAKMKPKEYEFFKEVVVNSQDDMFLAGLKKTIIMKNLNLSERTFWRRITETVNEGILIREGKGIYKFNNKWIKLLTLEVNVVGVDKVSIPLNKKLINLKL